MRPIAAPKESIGTLSADSAAELLALAADVTLIIDRRGVIHDYALGTAHPDLKAADWLGNAWDQVAAPDSRDAVATLLHGDRASGRIVYHWDHSGRPVAIHYRVVPLENGGYAAVGKHVQATLSAQAAIGSEHLRSLEQTTNLVGEVPLKDLVKASTDLIERLCIETALRMTDGNRASAASLLGLSRQSLYAKLRRHRLMASHHQPD